MNSRCQYCGSSELLTPLGVDLLTQIEKYKCGICNNIFGEHNKDIKIDFSEPREIAVQCPECQYEFGFWTDTHIVKCPMCDASWWTKNKDLHQEIVQKYIEAFQYGKRDNRDLLVEFAHYLLNELQRDGIAVRIPTSDTKAV